mmetsp:Transcript_35806/g.55095  ORF Transcript_35806/g.55095 Transcript_35806/m.55095 type:complete len:142 (+) Transcript_35806:169-594(+)
MKFNAVQNSAFSKLPFRVRGAASLQFCASFWCPIISPTVRANQFQICGRMHRSFSAAHRHTTAHNSMYKAAQISPASLSLAKIVAVRKSTKLSLPKNSPRSCQDYQPWTKQTMNPALTRKGYAGVTKLLELCPPRECKRIP